MKIIEFNDTIYYIGQNTSENDHLFKTMPNNATWFHLDSQSSSHVYCVSNTKLTKIEIKKGAELVKFWSKKTDKVIYIKKCKLKRIGPGLLELLECPKYV